MKNRKNRMLISIFMVILLLMLPVVAHGDIGNFAGDSDWSSSDWDSSSWDSDWDSGSSWDSDYSTPVFIGGFGGLGSIGTIIFIIAVIVIIAALRSTKKKNHSQQHRASAPARTRDAASIAWLKQLDPDFSEAKFTEDAANLYVRLQNAWQAKDLSPVRSGLTDNLYAQFERQLQPYIQNHRTNHVENIAVLHADLMSFAQDEANDILKVDLHTRITDYVTDDATGEIIKGSSTRELFMGYEYTFIRTKGGKSKAAADTAFTCPHCGAPLDLNHSGKCPYCDSVLNRAEYDWALTAIKGLYQRS